jgi:hypothetical protein
MTPNQYTDAYKKLSDENLLLILDNKKDYQPLAIETAIHELNSRQLTDKQIADTRQINIDNKNKKDQSDKILQERIDSAKKTVDKAFTLLDPFIEKTPERFVRLICPVLGIVAIYKFISNYSYIKFALVESSTWEYSDLLIFYDILFLPIALVFLWKFKNIGRILFSFWLGINLISAVSLFLLLLNRSNYDSPLNYLMPQTDISVFLITIFLSGGLLYYINKKNVRTLFK